MQKSGRKGFFREEYKIEILSNTIQYQNGPVEDRM